MREEHSTYTYDPPLRPCEEANIFAARQTRFEVFTRPIPRLVRMKSVLHVIGPLIAGCFTPHYVPELDQGVDVFNRRSMQCE